MGQGCAEETSLHRGVFAVSRARRDARLRGLRWVVLSTLAGKCAAGVYHRRRWLPAVLRARRLARADGTPVHAVGGARRSFSGLYLIVAGPGSWDDLVETIECIRAFEGDAVKIAVLEDHTADCRAPLVQGRFPDVDVIRTRTPCCGPIRLYDEEARAIELLMGRYDFEALCKIDTDALVTGHGLVERAIARFRAEPQVGMLGAYRVNADGRLADWSFERWFLTHSVRWSRRMRRLVAEVSARGYDPSPHVQGGVYLLSRAVLDRMRSQGRLRWRQPWWSWAGEDSLMTMHVIAAGFDPASWGGPDGPIATISFTLPIPVSQIVEQQRLAIHTVRRGLEGETEEELRAFFRARRPQPEGVTTEQERC